MVTNQDSLASSEQISKAVTALRECVAKQNKLELFQNDKIFLQFSLKKIVSQPQKIVKIVLPQGWVDKTTRVCLFVKDVDKKSRDYEKTIAAYEDLLKDNGVDVSIKVFPLKKLKLEFNDYEAKKNLSNLYDIFMCDSRIIRLMPAYIGKNFIGRKKFLVQVRLGAGSIQKEVEKALKTSQCVMFNRGSTSQVLVGTLKQSGEDLTKNIEFAMSKIADSIPAGSTNIRIAVIKTEDSVAIPILVSLGNKDEVELPVSAQKPSLKRVGSLVYDPCEVEDVSTVTDGLVTVTPSGEVVIIKGTGEVTTAGERRKKKQKKE